MSIESRFLEEALSFEEEINYYDFLIDTGHEEI